MISDEKALYFSPRLTKTEAALRLLTLIVAVLLPFGIPTVARGQTVFAGTFRAGAGRSAAWVGKEWPDFHAHWDAFEKDGLRIIDFQTYTEHGRRLYAGIFEAGTYPTVSSIGKEWTAFHKDWEDNEKNGYRIYIFRTYVERGRRVYAGIFKAGTEGHVAIVGKELGPFVSEWQDLQKHGYRIFDFESYEDGGKQVYAGLFKPGTYPPGAIFEGEMPQFARQVETVEKQGRRILDLKTYVVKGKRVFTAIFEPGNDARGMWIGSEWENFSSRWHEWNKAGLRLTHLAAYDGGWDKDSANHVVMQPPNGPYIYGITATTLHCEGVPGTGGTPGPGASVFYNWPVDVDGSERFVRTSALEVKDRIFTLPYKDEPSMTHNGWLYSPGKWHHAVDYSTSPQRSFQVAAAAPGQVIHIGWDSWSGNTIIISHDAAGVVDAYRTIYVHLRNGASTDADNAWNVTVPTLKNPELDQYKAHLNATGCTQDPKKRNLIAANWGANETIDRKLLGKFVKAGQFLAWSGETGPGGNMAGDTKVNTHLHVFFAHRDPIDKKWYFFDPYGIYATPDCYPSGETSLLDNPRVRYPVAWKDGRPQYP